MKNTSKQSVITQMMTRTIIPAFCSALVAVIGFLVSIQSATATIYDWNLTTGGTWSTNTNWTPAAPAGGPDAASDTVNILTNITAASNIFLYNTGNSGDSVKSLGILNIGDSNGTHGFTLAPGTASGSLLFDGGGLGAQINQVASSAANTISAPIAINDNLVVTNDAASNLTISGAITGSGNVTFSLSNAGRISPSSVNNSGTVTLSGSGTSGFINITSIGSNVTKVTNNFVNTALTTNFSLGSLVVNAAGTTLENLSAVKTFVMNGGVTGTGDLIVQNNSSLLGGVEIRTVAVNNVGKLINRSTGSGGVIINSNIGSNVTDVIQDGTGTMTLAGTKSYTGDTIINKGFLSITNSSVSSSSDLVMGGGTLLSAFTGTQTFASTTFNVGASTITPNTTNTVALGGITRNVGATVNFDADGGYTTSNTNTNGTLGAGMTVELNDWASYNGSSDIVAATYTVQNNVNSWGTNQNITNNAAFAGSLGGDLAINTLRFNFDASGGPNLGTSVLTASRGILVTSSVIGEAVTISGGTVRGDAGVDLVVINNGGSGTTLSIDSVVANNTSATAFTKSGANSVTLNGVNTYTGNTYVNEGSLILSSTSETLFALGNANASNMVTGVGTASFDGLFRLNISGFTDPTGTWTLVNVGTLTESFGVGFGLAFVGGPAFTNSGGGIYTSGDWSFNTSTGILTGVIPEPSAWLLAAAGMTFMMVARRRRLS